LYGAFNKSVNTTVCHPTSRSDDICLVANVHRLAKGSARLPKSRWATEIKVHSIVWGGHGWNTSMVKLVPLEQGKEIGDTISIAVTIGIEDDNIIWSTRHTPPGIRVIAQPDFHHQGIGGRSVVSLGRVGRLHIRPTFTAREGFHVRLHQQLCGTGIWRTIGTLPVPADIRKPAHVSLLPYRESGC
ncbi:MAG: hypothetical protein WAT93_05440, partial [Pontixanthobacter sp.]